MNPSNRYVRRSDSPLNHALDLWLSVKDDCQRLTAYANKEHPEAADRLNKNLRLLWDEISTAKHVMEECQCSSGHRLIPAWYESQSQSRYQNTPQEYLLDIDIPKKLILLHSIMGKEQTQITGKAGV